MKPKVHLQTAILIYSYIIPTFSSIQTTLNGKNMNP